MSPFDPYGTPMSEEFEKALYDMLKRSLVVDFKKKNGRLMRIAFVSECCRVKHDMYYPSVQLPACKKKKVRGKLSKKKVRGKLSKK